jgi:hypothetical protein
VAHEHEQAAKATKAFDERAYHLGVAKGKLEAVSKLMQSMGLPPEVDPNVRRAYELQVLLDGCACWTCK